MSRVRVTIDRIVLKGVGPEGRDALTEGLRQELSRVLSDPVTRAGLTQSHRTPVLRLGGLPCQPGPSGTREFGGRLARAIGRGLSR